MEKSACDIATHTFTVDVSQAPIGDVVYFEDLTPNHNKTLVKFKVTFISAPGAVTLTLVFETDGGTISKNIVPIAGYEAAYQAENVRSIAVNMIGGGLTGELYIQKTFCMNCT